jgi:DNA-binding NarL/FixJ family response regulator
VSHYEGWKYVAQIRILIADDHELVRRGIRALLEGQPDFHIVSEASNGVEAVRKAMRDQPDEVLLNTSMPELNGLAGFY